MLRLHFSDIHFNKKWEAETLKPLLFYLLLINHININTMKNLQITQEQENAIYSAILHEIQAKEEKQRSSETNQADKEILQLKINTLNTVLKQLKQKS